MNKLIVANWKMNPSSIAEAQQILDSASEYLGSLGDKSGIDLVFCPPFIFLEEVGKILKSSPLAHQSVLGAQDIFWDDAGADTGEISGPMLNRLEVRYVIVGHSERRWNLGESDEVVNKKLKAALRNDIVPIVCIGEKTRTGDYKKFLEDQVNATFDGLNSDEIVRCLIAYEPVWAISSNPNASPDTPESAIESISYIKKILNTQNTYLYGGSVNSSNILDFISNDQINGVLVGGASVNREEFIKLLSKIR